MANPSVTYTFSNSTTADATQVNQNFTDIINGITDGTKDLSISALTCAGNVSFNGTVTLGNASGDDITLTGSLASSIGIKTTATYNIGSSTHGLAGIYFGGNSQTTRIINSSSASATWTLTLPPAAPGVSGLILESTSAGVATWETRSKFRSRSVSSTDSVLTTDDTILLSGASFTLTLPTAASVEGKEFTLIHNGTNLTQVYTLATTSAQTIGGIASGSYALYTNGEVLKVVSDGSNWVILDHKTYYDFGVTTTTVTASSVNPSKGTMNTDTIRWWRIGKYIRGYINFIQTSAGSAGTGTYYIATLSNVTPDTGYINYNTLTSSLGTDLGRDSIGMMPMSGGGSFGVCAAYLFDATKMTFKYSRTDTAGAGGVWGSSNLPLSTATANFSGYLEYPVSGWQP